MPPSRLCFFLCPFRCLCLSVSLAPSVIRSTAAVSWKPWERLTGADRTASATPGDDAISAGAGAGDGALDAQPWKLYEGSPDTVRVAQGFRPSLVLGSCVRGRCPNKYWRCLVWLAPAQVCLCAGARTELSRAADCCRRRPSSINVLLYYVARQAVCPREKQAPVTYR